MKRLLLGLGAVLLIGAALAWSGPRSAGPEFDFRLEKRNPVSKLELNNAPGDFQFAIVSDRTGGHRPQAFSRAVEQINLLQPEFVVCVGDLIEGYTTDKQRLEREWREFQGYVNKLQMPFFYVPGNHDLSNVTQAKLWRQKFGRSYYEFVYRDVLFLALSSEDTPGVAGGAMSPEQLAWLERTLAANAGARWVLVFLHQPMWAIPDLDKNGWARAEKALRGRPYTVFCGHIHRYRKFVRQGRNYYQLATTGGASKMRGVDYNEFDHIVWVTMKKDGPVLANVLLDGVLPEDLRSIATAEEGQPLYNRRPTERVSAKVLLDGRPVPGASVVLQSTAKGGRPRADGLAGANGSVKFSTYTADDGVPAGEYVVTVEWRRPFFDAEGKPGPNKLPPRYASAATSTLRCTIMAGANDLTFELTSK